MFERERLMKYREAARAKFARFGEQFETLQDRMEAKSQTARQWLTEKKLVRPLLIVILFVFGIGAGVGLKLVAEDYITIGHEDYRLLPEERLYDLNRLQETAIERGASLAVPERVVYPACKYE